MKAKGLSILYVSLLEHYFSGCMMLDHLDILDEARVTAVDDAIADGRVSIVVQNISPIDHPEEILYGECYACLIDPDGTFHRASEFIPNLEALCATPLLDRHILRLAMDHLEENPSANLGCNLSADNMSGSGSWAQIYQQIASRPHLASRLVLEITETKPWTNAAMAYNFLTEVKQLGCRIAIDDFGIGCSTVLRLPSTLVDIVKIDALFINESYRGSDDPDKFGHLVGLAGLIVPIIVIDGIETATQLEMVRASGASHMQGYWLSKPSLLQLGRDERNDILIPDTCYQNWNQT